MRVRQIDRASDAEIELVASRMRETLVEVLGEERGGSMYTMDWLVQRARFHLDTARCTGEIFLAEDGGAEVVGHTIVRIESDEANPGYGLFSTIFVAQERRITGVASRLLEAGEAWMLGHGLGEARTYTDEFNTPLIRLFEKHGYAVAEVRNAFAVLVKVLAATHR